MFITNLFKKNIFSYIVFVNIFIQINGVEMAHCTAEGLAGSQPGAVCYIINFLKLLKANSAPGHENPKPAFNSFLFYGKRGTGKTSIGEAIAKEVGQESSVMIRADIILTEADSVELVKEIYEKANKISRDGKGKNRKPYVIILDEIDSVAVNPIFKNNGNVVKGLNELKDQITKHAKDPYIITILIANRHILLDERLRSCCNFVQWQIPSLEDRKAIISHYANLYLTSNVDWNKIAKKTALFTGRDIEEMFKIAIGLAANEKDRTITGEILLLALYQKRREVYEDYRFMCLWFGCWC